MGEGRMRRELRGERGDLQLQFADGGVGDGGGRGVVLLPRQRAEETSADAGHVVQVIVQEGAGEACERSSSNEKEGVSRIEVSGHGNGEGPGESGRTGAEVGEHPVRRHRHEAGDELEPARITSRTARE